MFPSMANASDLSAALSMHCIVAASCFLWSESCFLMVFDACVWTLSAYSLASLTMSFKGYHFLPNIFRSLDDCFFNHFFKICFIVAF